MKTILCRLISCCLAISLFSTLMQACSVEAQHPTTLSWSAVTRKEENKKERYVLDIEYPKFKFEGKVNANAENAVETLNAIVKTLIDDEIREAKKAFAENNAEMASVEALKDNCNELYIGHQTSIFGNNLASIILDFSCMSLGAAHPSNYRRSLLYSLHPAGQIELGQIFKPGSNYLDAISSFCIKELKERMKEEADDQWIKNGAGAKFDNFKVFALKGSDENNNAGIEILFDQYQVACYAAGPQDVLIPFSSLSDLMDRNSPVYKALSGEIRK